MEPERWREIERVYQLAREQAPERRAAILERTCGGDRELRREVESLLDCAEGAEEFVAGVIGRNMPYTDADLFADTESQILESGSTFGRYTILRLVGSGGMGEVYLARDTRLQRDVALKLLPSWLNDEEQLVSRFEREALAASRLNHPNVPVVYEAGEIGRRHFIASEYVEGFPLTDRIGKGKIPLREAVALAVQVGQALGAAHAAGIVHRDVKPGNILIRSVDGRVKLVDFGIARIAEGFELRTKHLTSLTSAGVVIGTPAYMAPEQAAGQVVDCRADIWSLAAVLQEMVTGVPRVPGATRVETSSDLPAALAAALERALEPDPDRRYQTVMEFADGLSRAQRRVLPIRAFFAAAAVLLFICALLFAYRPKPVEPRLMMENPRKLTNRGNVRDAIISPDSRYVIYSVGESGRESLRLLQVRTGADLERIPYADGSYIGLAFAPNDNDHFYYTFDPHADIRDLYEASVIPGIEPKKIVHDIDSPVAISHDGRRISYLRGIKEPAVQKLHVADIDGSHDRVLTTRSSETPFTVGGVTWSRDDKRLYAAEMDGKKVVLTAIDVSSARRQVMPGPDWSYVGRISVLDGDTLIFPADTAQGSSLFQYKLAAHKATRITPEGESYSSGYSAGGDIVSVRKDRLSSVWTVPADAPDAALIVTPPAGQYDLVAWSSGGTLIASIAGGGPLWRLGRGGTREKLIDDSYRYTYLTGSPDGHTVAFSTNRAGGWSIWTMDNDTHSIHQITYTQLEDQSPTFTPDGWILYGHQAQDDYRIWRVRRTGGEASQLMGMVARSPAVSPSGSYLVCRLLDEKSEKWQVAVLDLRSRKVIAQYPEIRSGSRVKWSPDETALTYVRDVNGVSNVWKTPTGGGSEARLTAFKEQKIFSFDWSPDGRNLAMVRGTDASEVVLFSNSK